tara:strand:+ start:691 stop:3351 length:2661 start_codon:yes stop_codon:yes gene_type:complete
MILNTNSKIKEYKNGDFHKYLNHYKIAKYSDFTHTSMGNPGGSYFIQAENNNEFLSKYIDAIENNEILHITEKHKRLSPILIDFDFRFDIVNSTSLKRNYKISDILKLLEIYIGVLDTYVDTNNIKIYILEKTKPSMVNNIGKDGIHIIIPDIITKSNIQYIVRNKCLKLMEPIFKELNFVNSVEDIFDEAVIENNNWLMYGSSKPDKESYKVTSIYEYNIDNIDNIDFKKIENNYLNKEYIKLFSIRNKNTETPIKSLKVEEITNFDNIVMENERKDLTCKQIFKSSVNHKKNNTLDITIVKKFVEILDPNRSKSFDSWIRVGWCLRNIDNNLLEDWIKFSQKSPKYKDGECETKWDYMKDGNLGIGTLRMWAKNDNKDKYNKLIQDDLQSILKKAKTGTHTDVSRVIYKMFKYDFVCSNVKKNIWWEFKNHKWYQSDSGYGIKIRMSNQVYREFLRIANDYFTQALQVDDDDNDEQDRLKKIGDQYSKIANSLKNQTQKTNYLKECTEIFYHEKFEDKLDSKCTLIGFNNGVYDLETYEFRDGHPDDFISFSTNINYIEYNETDKTNNDIMEFISQILPNIELKEYFLKLFASFLNGNITSEKFHIFTGFGSNGKSKIIELYQNVLGDYCGQFNVSLLTQKRVSSNSSNSELAKSKGKRFMVLQEPGEDEKLNIGYMKEITGGDRIIARGLYQDPIEFKPQFHLVLTCNHLPMIPSDDGGTWRRIRVIEFTSLFIEKPDSNNKNEFKMDTELSLRFDDWKENFMSILIHFYKRYILEGIYEPEDVLKCTKEYQKDNDIMKLYIEEKIVSDNKGFLSLNDLYNDFKYWFKDSGVNSKPPTKSQISKYMQKNKNYGKIKTKSGVNGWENHSIKMINIIDDDDDDDM